MDLYTEIKVLARVLNTGTIMSIEKNEQELKGLIRDLEKQYGCAYVCLFNCFTGALQAALKACGIAYGDRLLVNQKFATAPYIHFIRYHGVDIVIDESLGALQLSPDIAMIDPLQPPHTKNSSSVTLLDFTPLGYGPAAALLTDQEEKFFRADRLKIFGEQDLKTMWENKESNPNCLPTVQYNYRLSPLVAALIRLKLIENTHVNRISA